MPGYGAGFRKDQVNEYSGAGKQMIKYQELVESVSGRTGTDPGTARAATEATVTALARALEEPDRGRLSDALPDALRGRVPAGAPARKTGQREFVDTVARLAGHSREQARIRAQAVLSTIAEREPGMVSELNIPLDLQELLEPPPAGG
jgi:uncharacterized protein (DUF2267 family)